jgi:hypothetical protein
MQVKHDLVVHYQRFGISANLKLSSRDDRKANLERQISGSGAVSLAATLTQCGFACHSDQLPLRSEESGRAGSRQRAKGAHPSSN